jgi:fatty acid desaturase
MMEENYHTSKTVSKEQLKTLMQRNNQPAVVRFVIMYLSFLATAAWAVMSWGGPLWNILLSQFVFGLFCCSFFACEHETAHKTAFKSKRLNDIAGRLVGIVHLYSLTAFRELHFTHHRHTHVPGLDPEISFGNRPMPSMVKTLPSYFSWLTGIPILSFKILMLIFGAVGMPEFARKNLFPFVRQEVRFRLAIESIYILFFQCILLYLTKYVYIGFIALFIGQLVGHGLLATYTVTEHNGLPYEGNILNRTRSMRTSNAVKILMWNMPYHAEHHAYPSIPFHALPKLHELIKDEITHRHETYPKFHVKVLKREIL